MEKKNEFTQKESAVLPYDPIVLLLDILKHWRLVLTIALVILVAGYIFLDQSYKPVYKSDATLVVTTQDSTSTVYSNLKSTSELASVFTELLNSSLLQKIVLDELGMAAHGFKVQASAIEATNLLNIQVTAGDPATAFLVLCSLIENHEIVTFEVVGDMVIEVLKLPEVPRAPINASGAKRDALLLVVFGILVSCAGIAFYSYSRDAIRSEKEAEMKLPYWCLGEILHEKKYRNIAQWKNRKEHSLIITDPSISFCFVETMRKLRRRVEQYMTEGNVLMVTSVAENEGKSTVAVNLALSLAKKHKHVLLIDLDLRKPACRQILRCSDKYHSTKEVITGKSRFDEAVVTDRMSGLDMILGKQIKKASSALYETLISSDGVAVMLQEAGKRYKYVVVDMPPVSVAGDAEHVMDHVDAALLVIQQNGVSAKAIKKASKALGKGRAKMLGCVLNNVYVSHWFGRSGNGYGYGYGYGYGSGYGKYGQTQINKASGAKKNRN